MKTSEVIAAVDKPVFIRWIGNRYTREKQLIWKSLFYAHADKIDKIAAPVQASMLARIEEFNQYVQSKKEG